MDESNIKMDIGSHALAWPEETCEITDIEKKTLKILLIEQEEKTKREDMDKNKTTMANAISLGNEHAMTVRRTQSKRTILMSLRIIF